MLPQPLAGRRRRSGGASTARDCGRRHGGDGACARSRGGAAKSDACRRDRGYERTSVRRFRHPAEHRGANLMGTATTGFGRPRMVRYPIALLQVQDLPQRQVVGASPLDSALRVVTLQIADQVHPEVPPRRARRRPHPRLAIRRAQILGKTIKIGVERNPLKAIIEYVARRSRHLRPRHHQLTLPSPLSSQRYP